MDISYSGVNFSIRVDRYPKYSCSNDMDVCVESARCGRNGNGNANGFGVAHDDGGLTF